MVDVGGLALEEELPRMPAELRAAFEAAGTVEEEGIEPGEADSTIAMRAVCALAGLPLTLSALRQVPLVVLPFG
ncbi:hypothetical protein [Streptomyces daghestanicus]|uniref:Uncharacterized protein n=1 Tax=Streptomyces daghestanicus TaxID=66885 RepID=A0ABQ3QE40_9ACTN|nr:hypothetical protein [Streptomyces daghestanicus]GGU57564.1 hypothetical protein GCM10010259_55740 [Streptomyces daghestanicus]GHI35550.1 hypothetical protein Sdagh_72800 [Streptomyces daghestanicus]